MDLRANDAAIQAVPDDELPDYILAGFATITNEDCTQWFKRAGYV